eukprot:CAMPEP_0205929764 /NCGR_PEP_ID=MMETSP1325-20131115/25501_1 /ASSEMBLY_ACC=CAM_ASM_000708 /TAXON_ID=236786 /ORGANISM="Florenciella sp., Strain RCC1007" /LENGTH=76 /DNA_ID=CAMNT_0053299033 /DNA_START=112 /DNA_END=339 /DNA_ORIENTATION=-
MSDMCAMSASLSWLSFLPRGSRLATSDLRWALELIHDQFSSGVVSETGGRGPLGGGGGTSDDSTTSIPSPSPSPSP